MQKPLPLGGLAFAWIGCVIGGTGATRCLPVLPAYVSLPFAYPPSPPSTWLQASQRQQLIQVQAAPAAPSPLLSSGWSSPRLRSAYLWVRMDPCQKSAKTPARMVRVCVSPIPLPRFFFFLRNGLSPGPGSWTRVEPQLTNVNWETTKASIH